MKFAINDPAVDAALRATNESGYRHITALSVSAILEAAAPYIVGAFAPALEAERERVGVNPYQQEHE